MMATLRERARALLEDNDRGGATIPSPTLYPHIWNWDSAFAAMGWATFDVGRALGELERLLAAAWPDGMVPHIVFNPDASGYEPGPAWYGTEGHPAAGPLSSSSVTQPPVAATALRRVLEHVGGQADGDGDAADARARAAAMLPALDAWHRWFLRDRDPRGLGLPAIIHPWESGWDNSPRWDAALAVVPETETFTRVDTDKVDAGQRPTADKYRRYAWLIKATAERDFAPPGADWPFLVVDVAIAAILVQAERDLAFLVRELATELGDNDGALDAAAIDARADALAAAIEAQLFDSDSGRFVDYDVVAHKQVDAASIARHVPIYAGLGGARAVDAFLAALDHAELFGTPFVVPTVARNGAAYDRRRYWRGPCWINVNWLLIRGLQRAGRDSIAESLTSATARLAETSGFREYYDPETGVGLGAGSFSWSAALLLDLLGGS